MSGEIDGRPALLGSLQFLDAQGIAFDAWRAERLARSGNTVVGVALDGRPLGFIALADALRPTSKPAIERLRRMGIDTRMLTGDHEAAAGTVASALGIRNFRAGVSPADKAATVSALKGENGLVGMAGDGINDAPALAAADIGFALAEGSDIAIEAADITLVRNDLGGVTDAIDLSRHVGEDPPEPVLRVRLQRAWHSPDGARSAQPGDRCERSVSNLLRAVPGVREARVSLERGEARIVFDPAKTGVAQIKEAILDAGYQAD